MKLTLLVLRSKKPELLSQAYSQLGMKFDHHRHGKGPYHFAAEFDGMVFEIYPSRSDSSFQIPNERLGFQIRDAEKVLAQLDDQWKLIQPFEDRGWGKTAILEDPEGRKVELSSL